MNRHTKTTLKDVLFWIIFIIDAPLPLVGGLLYFFCGSLGLIDIEL